MGKKKVYFCGWKRDLAARPSEDEGTVCIKLWRRDHAQNKETWTTKTGLISV